MIEIEPYIYLHNNLHDFGFIISILLHELISHQEIFAEAKLNSAISEAYSDGG